MTTRKQLGWWCIACVSLTGRRGPQRAGKHPFWEFLERVSLWIGMKQRQCSLGGLPASSPLGAGPEEREVQGEGPVLAPSSRTGTSISSCPGTLALLLLRTSDSGWSHTPHFPGSPAWKQQAGGLSISLASTWSSSSHKPSLLCISVYPIGCFLENPGWCN